MVRILQWLIGGALSISAPLVAQEETPTATTSRDSGNEVILVVGKPISRRFDFPIGDIAVGAPQVCSAVADRGNKRIIFTPLSPGETSVLVFDTDGRQRENIRITVTSQDLEEFAAELRKLFSEIDGISIKRTGQKILIEGEVYLREDIQRIFELTRGNRDVVVLVKLSADTQKILAKKIEREIGLPAVQVSATKGRIVLRGEVFNEGDIEKASRIASIYVEPSQIVNVLTFKKVDQPPAKKRMVQITAYFVELNKKFLRNFSFSFSPVPTFNVDWFGVRTPNGQFSNTFNFAGQVTDVLPKLNTARALGVARVFENPTVAVKSEEEAVVEGGAQVSFPVIGQNGGVGFAKPESVGVTLRVRPFVIGENEIDVKVEVSVRALGDQTIPGAVLIKNSSVSTSQFVRNNESVAIGGLIRSQSTENRDRPPEAAASSGIVVFDENLRPETVGQGAQSSFGNLFSLFKARDQQKERSEFIVFITPRILQSAGEANAALREFMNIEDIYPTTVVTEEELE